jgi:hypothetical protein
MPPAPSDTTALLAWLATRDIPCPVCGYNLRALPDPRCPECNAPLTLQVWSENAGTGPWLVALISFALAAGFDGVVSLLAVGEMALYAPNYRSDPAAWGVLATFVALALVSGGAIWWLARHRRRFWRLPRQKQWIIAGGIFAAVGLIHATFGLGVILFMAHLF